MDQGELSYEGFLIEIGYSQEQANALLIEHNLAIADEEEYPIEDSIETAGAEVDTEGEGKDSFLILNRKLKPKPRLVLKVRPELKLRRIPKTEVRVRLRPILNPSRRLKLKWKPRSIPKLSLPLAWGQAARRGAALGWRTVRGPEVLSLRQDQR